jgi:hypothetical protein
MKRGILRWSAPLIVGLIGLCLAFVIAFRDNLFRWTHDPQVPFQTAKPPEAPDYSSAASWYLHPGPDASRNDSTVAVFLIHPTTYWGRDGWNAALDAPRPTERLETIYGPNARIPFEKIGPVHAPRYRQASLYSALTHRFDARRARELARDDVLAAFEHFLTELGPSQPFILAGFEQGGLHGLAVLAEVARNELLTERLIAAYVIEQAVPLDLFRGSLKGIGPCDTAQTARCVVSYAAIQSSDEREMIRFQNRSMVWDERGELAPTAGRKLLCVNPLLNAAREDFALRRLHAGGVNARQIEVGISPPALGAQTSAQCQAGILLIEQPISSSLREPLSWGARFKPSAVRLFAADLEKDARLRIAAHAASREQDGIPLPLVEDMIMIERKPVATFDN